MADVDNIHARFIHKANALSEKFEGAAALVAKIHGKAVEDRLGQLLDAVEKVPGNPYESAEVRAAVKDFYSDVEKLGLELFGPGSVFEAQTQTVLASMARNGLDRLADQFQAQKFVLKQTLLDTDSIKAAVQDTYEIAARNLADVTPLRELMTREIIQGNGVPALTRALVEKGFLTDLQRGNRTYSVEQRARMMARTEPRRLQESAYQQATAKVEPDEKKRLYKWVSVLGQTSTQDSFDRHGHIMSKAEWETHSWPNDNFAGLPPLRPNDRCSVIFYREAWLTDEGLEAMSAEAGSEGRRVLSGHERAVMAEARAAAKPVKARASRPRPSAPVKATPARPVTPGGIKVPTFKSVAEAQTWAVKSGATREAVFRGMTVSGANTVNRWLAVHVIDAKMPKLKRVTARKMDALASYNQINKSVSIGPRCWDPEKFAIEARENAAKYAARAKLAEKEVIKWAAVVDEIQEDLTQQTAQRKKLPKGVQRDALSENMKLNRGDLKRAQKTLAAKEVASKTVRFNGAHTVEDVLTHEYGHHIHSLAGPDSKMSARLSAQASDVKRAWVPGEAPKGYPFDSYGYGYDRLGGKYTKGRLPIYANLDAPSSRRNLTPAGEAKAAPVSVYASTNHKEHLAEAYVSYMRGELGSLAPEVIDVIEELIENAKGLGLDEWGE